MKFDRQLFRQSIIEKRCELQKAAERNLGLRELGKMSDTSASTLVRVLDCRKADIDTILTLCKWLDKGIMEFIYEENAAELIPEGLKEAVEGLN